MRWIVCLLLLLTTFEAVFAQDPVNTDSDKYKLVLENERVRVLDYRD